MIKGQRCLVTGGAGTIGSTIVDQLVAAGAAEVVVLDNLVRGRRENLAGALASGKVALVEGDIRDRGLVAGLMAGIDLVFHQAAIRITQCAEEPRLALEVLVDGTYEVVEAAADAGVRKVVAASSASVYGLAEEFPTAENHHPYDNDTLYGAAKTFNEGLLRSFPAMRGLDYVALRYFNVYGPRMDIYGLYTEVLIRWMERIEAGEPPLILGDGLQTMDFVYTEDIARANLLAADGDVTGEVFNIGSGTETSLRELAAMLLQVMGADLEPEFGPARSVNGVTRRLADVSAAAERLGWKAEVGLEEGLARLVSWWRAERAKGTDPGPRCGGTAPEGLRRKGPRRDHPGHAAVARRGGGAGRRGRGRVRLGRAGAPGGAVRGRVRRGDRRRARGRRVLVHDRAAPGAHRRRDRPRRRGRGPVAVVHRHRERGPLRGGGPGLRRRRPGHAEPDPGHHRPRLTGRTRAVIVVDQAGVPADLDAIRALCEPRGIAVVEDAACAAGAVYRGRPAGAAASLAAFSFHPRKLLTTGEGGMVVTPDADWPPGCAGCGSTA